jgi:outer membrane protein assembly factor BamB
MSRRALVLAVAATFVVGVAGCKRGGMPRPVAGGPEVVGFGPGPAGPGPMMGLHTIADRGEQTLAHLPWQPDVLRANLASRGPVALTGFYLMHDDVLAISNTGTIYCLSLRDLTPRWVSTLRYPLLKPPAESPVDYVFLVEDPRGAAYLEVFSKRSGAESDASPIRLRFAPSSGIAATAAAVYVGSLGSPVDNKTLEVVNLVDGSLGWGYRTSQRIVADPVLDPAGEILVVASEDDAVTALPANPPGTPPSQELWISRTLGANSATPVLTKDWAFVGSQDNMLRGYNVHSGEVQWMRGTDAPILRAPWVLGGQVVAEVASGGAEGAPKVKVETFEGIVFVRNALGLHAFDATTGDPLFRDRLAERPLVRMGSWLLTMNTAKGAQIRQGKDWAVQSTVDFSWADFVPTNGADGVVVTATTDGMVLLARPK